MHARRTHRSCSNLSSDSQSGIVPFSEFELICLHKAWFFLECSEMLMQAVVGEINAEDYAVTAWVFFLGTENGYARGC